MWNAGYLVPSPFLYSFVYIDDLQQYILFYNYENFDFNFS